MLNLFTVHVSCSKYIGLFFFFRTGPFINVWCMRMEAKNSYCKKVAQSSNFKNVPYTVANRHQRLLCSYLNDPDGFFDTKVKCGPS